MNLLKLLDRPIAFHPCFVDLAGSVNAALVLSQAIYWHNRTSDPEGWFYKTSKDWQSETRLTRHELENARSKLRELNFWQEDLKGRPPKLHFRIEEENLLKALKKLDFKFAGKRQIKFAGKRQPNLPESGKSNLPESGKSSLLHIDYMDRDHTETTLSPQNAGRSEKKPPKVSPKKPESNNPNHRHPMAEVYREVMEYPALTRLQCDQIAAQVTDEGTWRAILTERNMRFQYRGNVQRALFDYERAAQGETIEQIYGGKENGNGKQQTYETKGERNARHTLAIAERLAERRQRRILDAADSGDTEATGITLIRNER